MNQEEKLVAIRDESYVEEVRVTPQVEEELVAIRDESYVEEIKVWDESQITGELERLVAIKLDPNNKKNPLDGF